MVRDHKVHEEVIEKIQDFALNNGFSVLGLTFSPVKGPEGNIEYLIYLQKSDMPERVETVPAAATIVEESHLQLDKS